MKDRYEFDADAVRCRFKDTIDSGCETASYGIRAVGARAATCRVVVANAVSPDFPYPVEHGVRVVEYIIADLNSDWPLKWPKIVRSWTVHCSVLDAKLNGPQEVSQ